MFIYSIVLLIITVLFVVGSLPFNSVLLISSVRIFNPHFLCFSVVWKYSFYSSDSSQNMQPEGCLYMDSVRLI
jgi:hypothetical protein